LSSKRVGIFPYLFGAVEVPPNRSCPVLGPPCRTGQAGERESCQGLEHLAGEEASGAGIARPGAGKPEVAAGWVGPSAACKWEGQGGTLAARETPAEYTEEKLSLRVVKH